jgi:hypothetical protein
MLDRGDFPKGYTTALAFDLRNEKTLKGQVLALANETPQLSFIELPFAIKNLSVDQRHVVLTWQRTNTTIVSYNMRPSRSSSLELASFDPIFSTDSALDALIGDATAPDQTSNLYFIRSGLQRLFLLRLPEADKIKLEGSENSEIDVKIPDLIAVQLPEHYVGRTFPTSGRMFDPAPLTQHPLVLFSANNLNASKRFVRIRYDLPAPDWIPDAVSFGMKFLALLLPIVLIAWSDPGKANPRRYRITVVGIGCLYLLGYGYMIYLTMYSGGSYSEIFQNLGFAIGTAFAAWLTYFIKNKAQAAPVSGGAAII